MNGPVIVLVKGTKVHHRLKGTNLLTRYGFSEGSCFIPNKAAYMDDDTLEKVVKVVSPGFRKMKVVDVSCFFLIYSLYI